MSPDYIDAITFVFHVGVLLVNLWLLYVITNLFIFNKAPHDNTYMVLVKRFEVVLFFFTLLIVLSEVYFLYVVFMDLDAYIYEYIAMADQVVLGLLLAHFINKGGHTDGD